MNYCILKRMVHQYILIDLKNNEMSILYFVSSRYFRMPILPHSLINGMDIIIDNHDLKTRG